MASILVTLGLAYLLKMLAAASGAAAIHLAPPALEPNRIVRASDVLHGELVRDPMVPGLHGPAGAHGQMPSPTRSENLQSLQNGQGGNGDQAEALKRHQVEAYLATLSPRQLDQLTAREVADTLKAQGVEVSERYVAQLLDGWNARRGSGARRRAGR